MTIGEKIKVARSLKGITQKELGYLVGLPDVRIRQYETDARTPKEGMLRAIASALGVSYFFFVSHNIDTLNDVMHALFEVEHTFGAHVKKIEVPGKPDTYAVLFDDTGLNERIKKWHEQEEIYLSNKGENTEKDYLFWEANFPESMNRK